MALPNYISFRGHGETSVPLPVTISDVRMYCFALRVDKNQTKRYVDSVLNAVAPQQFHFKVLGNHVLLVFVYADKGSSPSVGWEKDAETCFFIPLIKEVPLAGPPHFLVWPCYPMIESSLGLTTGREILGYNKSQGFTTVPLRAPDQLVFSTKTVTFDVLDSGTEGKLTTLVSVNQKDPAKPTVLGPLADRWLGQAEGLRAITAALETFAEVAAAEVNSLIGGVNVPVINLKQIRDAEHNDKACYQALVVHKNTINWKEGGLLPAGNYVVDLRPCASHRIAADLGLVNPTAPNSYTAQLAFWIGLDFIIEPGTNLWSAF